MPVGNLRDVAGVMVTHPEARGAVMRVLVGPELGWEDHVMRVFELEPGGHTPRHAHEWPHINYIISGRGTLFLHGQENELAAGGYAYVPAGELHQFQNIGNEPFVFICIVPEKGHY